jgi:hypothetical protein
MEGSNVRKILVLLGIATAAGTLVPVPSWSDAEADRAALQAELDALMGEILEASEDGTALFDGADGVPDLVVLSSSDVRGEVSPCG